MAHLHIKVFFILTLLFFAVDAKDKDKDRKHSSSSSKSENKKSEKKSDSENKKSKKHPSIQHMHLPFTIFGNHEKWGGNKNIDAGLGSLLGKPDFDMDQFQGHWDLISQDSGVSAMQINLMPTNKIVVYDATVYRLSRLKYPPGQPCVPFMDDRTKQQMLDCFAHSMEYDLATNQVRPLKVSVIITQILLSLFVSENHFKEIIIFRNSQISIYLFRLLKII